MFIPRNQITDLVIMIIHAEQTQHYMYLPNEQNTIEMRFINKMILIINEKENTKWTVNTTI